MAGLNLVVFCCVVAASTASYTKPAPVLVPHLYQSVYMNECGVEYLKEVEIKALAGSMTFRINKKELPDETDCTLRLNLPKDNSVALWMDDFVSFPINNALDDCENGQITVSDTSTEQILNEDVKICESQQQKVNRAYLSEGRAVDVRILIPDTIHVQGNISFDMTFLAFKPMTNTSKDDCYVCNKKNGDVEDPLCIDKRLKCDSVSNCIGEYEDDEAFAITRDEHCRFVCNATDVNGTAISVDGIDVCNVFTDCPGGEDEDAVLCARDELFGPLGLGGGIIIILCVILLIIVVALGVYKRRKHQVKKKRSDTSKYSKGEEPARGDAV